MAMKKCRECGTDVSSKAESCPKCGARLKAKPMGCAGVLGAIILGLIILAAFESLLDSNSGSTSSVASTASNTDGSSSSTVRNNSKASASPPVTKAPSGAQWVYNSSRDSMSGKLKQTALLVSNNSLHLSFPYGGANYGHLIVRQHPQYGLDVIVQVDKGQILCGLYTCKLKIRFNNGSVQTFTMAPSADHSSTVVFAKHPQWAINHLKHAKKVFIQIPMYQEGNQVLKFKVTTPLVWPHK